MRGAVEDAGRALDAAARRSSERTREVLAERARLLALPEEAPAAAVETTDLLVFSVGGERYAVEPAYVVEAVPCSELTPLPGTPPTVQGVINHRGRILPIVDLRRLLGAGAGAPAGSGAVIALEAAGVSIGVACDTIDGLLRLAADELGPPPHGTAAAQGSLVYAVTRDLIALLDVEALVLDPRIEVNDEIS